MWKNEASKCSSHCKLCTEGYQEDIQIAHSSDNDDAWFPDALREFAPVFCLFFKTSNRFLPGRHLVGKEIPPGWITSIEDTLFFVALNVSHLSSQFYVNFLSKSLLIQKGGIYTHLSDGAADLVYQKYAQVSRIQAIKELYDSSKGNIIEYPGVVYRKVAFVGIFEKT